MDMLVTGLKAAAVAAGIAALVLAAAMLAALVHTLLFVPHREPAAPPEGDPGRAEAYARKLSRMLQCDTVSGHAHQESSAGTEKYLAFHRELEALFPLVHKYLQKTEIDGNLLFFWKGKRSDRPLVLMSHQDTVPVEREEEWLHGPFSGEIAEGSVWGRGACDTKCSVMGFFQAVEELLEEGYVPEEDVYLSASRDEETLGTGCARIVDYLTKQGVKPWLVCDEGGAIMPEPIPGVRGSFAMVGVLEKGMANVRFTAHSEGGHASTPRKNMPLARLAGFVGHMEHHDPYRRRMPPAVRQMMTALAPWGSFPVRYVFSNLWLFGPLVARVIPDFSPQAAAMLQSTIAFTQCSGSEAPNMFPVSADVTANMRFIPHQRMEETLALTERIAKKYDLEMEVLSAEDATDVSRTDDEAWELMQRTISRVFPGIGTSPYILTGGTDARFYQQVCDHVYRFAPVVLGPEEKAGIHGVNEHIRCSCLPGCVDFYKQLIRGNS